MIKIKVTDTNGEIRESTYTEEVNFCGIVPTTAMCEHCIEAIKSHEGDNSIIIIGEVDEDEAEEFGMVCDWCEEEEPLYWVVM